MFYYERKFRRAGYTLIVGVDEAGRGPLAGPVVAAAVALATTRFKNRIDDSKKLSVRQRERAFGEIVDSSLFGVGIANETIIDAVNILEATRIAMEHAVGELMQKARKYTKEKVYVLVDGDVRLDIPHPYVNIIKGDAKSKSIASASIVAKVIRDRIMAAYDKMYPQYGFTRHKGYPTQEHRTILKKLGPTAIHRKSFCPAFARRPQVHARGLNAKKKLLSGMSLNGYAIPVGGITPTAARKF